MIALTFDTDWIDEKILESLVKILKDKKLKATFFVTGKYPILKNPLFEINPHINFNGTYSHYKEEFLKIKKFAPKGQGLRNHSLYFHERLRPVLLDLKIKYTSNILLPLAKNIEPIYIGKNLLELPIFFLDYWYMETFGPKASFNLKTLKLNHPGLKVFDFHPIHLALNCPNVKFYEQNRHLYHHPEKIQGASFSGEGMNTLFKRLLTHIIKNKVRTYSLGEIYALYRRTK